MENEETVQKEAEQSATVAPIIEKIRAAALAGCEERFRHPELADFHNVVYDVEWIARCSGADAEMYVVMMDIQYRCPDCDLAHRQSLPMYCARKGDDFIAMNTEMIMAKEEELEEEPEEEEKVPQIVLVPVSPALMQSIKKAMEEEEKNGG